jgi:hypothetical protein
MDLVGLPVCLYLSRWRGSSPRESARIDWLPVGFAVQ